MMINLESKLKEWGIQPKAVLHLGANLAQEARRYHAMGIYKMIFVEALPDIYEQMIELIKPYNQAIGVKACVSDVNGEKVTFHVANNEGQSSSFLNFGTHSVNHPTVKFIDDIEMTTQRIDSMGLDMEGVDLLVMDLQGVELRALRGCGQLINQFKVIYSEVNDGEVYEGCDKIWDMDEYLKQFGFERVETKMTGANWGDAIWIKNN